MDSKFFLAHTASFGGLREEPYLARLSSKEDVTGYRKDPPQMGVVFVSEERLKPYQDLVSDDMTLANYEEFLELLIEDFFAERGCLWLERENRFVYRGDEELRKRFPFSRQAVDAVLEEGRSFITFDTKSDPRIESASSMAMNNVRSCLCASCTDDKGEVLVVAYFDNTMDSEPFSHKDLKFLKQALSLLPNAIPVT